MVGLNVQLLCFRAGKELTAGVIATFNVDHKSSKELRQYLANIADQCESATAADLPAVIILDNLHHVGSLGEVFNGFLSVKYQKWLVPFQDCCQLFDEYWPNVAPHWTRKAEDPSHTHAHTYKHTRKQTPPKYVSKQREAKLSSTDWHAHRLSNERSKRRIATCSKFTRCETEQEVASQCFGTITQLAIPSRNVALFWIENEWTRGQVFDTLIFSLLQPIHHWNDEPSDVLNHQPAAAPQLPLGSVRQPHGAGQGFPRPLPQ